MGSSSATGSSWLGRLWLIADRPLIDWASAAVVTAVVWMLADGPLVKVNETQLTAALAAVAAVLALVGTFGVTAVMFFADRTSPVANDLRRTWGAALRRTLLGTFGAMVMASLGCCIALLFANGWFARTYILFALLLAAAKIARVVFVFNALLATDERAEYLRRHPAPKLVA